MNGFAALNIDIEDKGRWIAGLSNGDKVVENEGKFKGDDKDSSWMKLIKYCAIKNLVVRSLQIRYKGHEYTLASRKFGGIVPKDFWVQRKAIADINIKPKKNINRGSVKEKYLCIEAIYDNFRLQILVDELKGKKCWTNILPL